MTLTRQRFWPLEQVELFNGCQRETIRDHQMQYYARPGQRRESSKPRCEEYKRIFGNGQGGAYPYGTGGFYI